MLLSNHANGWVVYCPVVNVVNDVLACSFVLEQCSDHVYLPRGAGGLCRDAVGEADLTFISVCEDNCVVLIIGEEKGCLWLVEKLVSHGSKSSCVGSGDVGNALIAMLCASGKLVCDFCREEDHIRMCLES